ncbi:MAG: hypothetical protein LBT59_21770, partial [Clostridiales bacterium]|nr:hypothetical protein [Clostridiales bacterium]
MTNNLRTYLINNIENVSGVLDITSDSDVGFAVIVAKNEDDVVKDLYGKHIEIRREITAEVYDEKHSLNVANGKSKVLMRLVTMDTVGEIPCDTDYIFNLLEERLGSDLVKVEFRDITIFRPFVFIMVTVKTP